MSLPFAFNARRFLRQSPATFLRQCRTNTGKTFAVCAFATASPQTTHPTIPRDRNTRYPGRPLLPHSPALLRPDGRARPFSKSAPSHATTVLQNPRVGDDGNEMTIEISDRAAKRLQQITSSSSPSISRQNAPLPNHLRVSVTSGGCHGFQYLMALEPSAAIENDEDTIFASQDPSGSAKVVMDEASLELLKGSTIDYTTELIGSQFKIVGNPRAKSSCGCGTSFDIED